MIKYLLIKQITTTDLLQAEVITNESSGDVNNNKLANINKIKYGEYDKTNNIKNRLKRCIKECRKGRYKKGDDALNDGIIIDLNKNNNWNKVQSKFPDVKKLNKRDIRHKPEFKLKQQDSLKLVKQINSQSKGGKYGINNDIILWALERDDHYCLNHALWKLAKEIVENGLPKPVKQLLVYGKGVPLGKEKYGSQIMMFDRQ